MGLEAALKGSYEWELGFGGGYEFLSFGEE
jgi:hypothetical protein